MKSLFVCLSDFSPLQLCTALVVALLLSLSGCGGSKDYEEYVAPPDANAQLVVHPEWGDTFDVFLNGKHLGRISWTQAYPISAGQHVFSAKLPRTLKKRGAGAEYAFTIAPGETLHLAVVRWGEYGPGPTPGAEELIAGGIRISVINP